MSAGNLGIVAHVRAVYARTEVLDGLSERLAFPASWVQRRSEELPRVAMQYGRLSEFSVDDHRVGTDPAPDLWAQARAICENQTLDELFEHCAGVEAELAKAAEEDPELRAAYEEVCASSEKSVYDGLCMLHGLLYELVSVVEYGIPITALRSKAIWGDDEALLKLLRIDKTAIYETRIRWRILEAQYLANWTFFEDMGEAIAAPPIDTPPYMYRAFVVVAYLWDDVFEALSWPKTVRLLEDAGVLAKSVVEPRSFSKRLNLLGIKKTKHTREN